MVRCNFTRALRDGCSKWLSVKLLLAYAAFMMIFLSGCVTERGASRWYDNHPKEDELRCARKFPVDSVKTEKDTVYVQAENKDYTGQIRDLNNTIDSLNQVISTTPDPETKEDCIKQLNDAKRQIFILKQKSNSLATEYEPCKPDTIKITTTYTVRDRAQEAVLQRQIKETESSRTAWKTAAIIGFLTAIGLGVFLWISRRR